MVYSLVSDILRAAKALGIGAVLWKKRETKRIYRNPKGVGLDENQEYRCKIGNNSEEVTQEKWRKSGGGGVKVTGLKAPIVPQYREGTSMIQTDFTHISAFHLCSKTQN